MRKAKRSGGNLTRSSSKSRRTCKKEWISGCLFGNSNQDGWAEQCDGLNSYLSKCVASIALFNGDKILFSCSGIAMEHQGSYLTRFFTTAGLVRALDATTKDHGDLRIRVCLGTKLYKGFVSECDLDHNFAVVDVYSFLDVQVGHTQCALESVPHGQVLAVGRGVHGEIMVNFMESTGDSRVYEDDEDLHSRLPFHTDPFEGGALLSFDGNMVGMNRFLTKTRVVFLPWGTILKHYLPFQQKKTELAQPKQLKVHRLGARPIVHGGFFNQEKLDLESMGYPKLPSTMLGASMILVNSFEETFGDIRGEGVWKKFSKRAYNLNRNVVALASFNGEKRFFACTGFFIEWNGSTMILTSASLVRNSGDENKIDENLRIEVSLNNHHREGKLQHCNLHYNVALVSVKDYRALRPSRTLRPWVSSYEVAAVGRCFQSGALMATSGYMVPWSGTLDCEFLTRSTCKITKAGIGGPLVNLDGDIVGMNFYDTRIGTPFLIWEDIRKILGSFESEPGGVGNASDALFWKMPQDDIKKFNRWPVPMPRWCHPEEVEFDDDDELAFDPYSGQLKYGYILGERVNKM